VRGFFYLKSYEQSYKRVFMSFKGFYSSHLEPIILLSRT
jgi:hypothetical protein